MKKLFALMLALIMVFALAAPVASAADETTLTLWTYPIGGWGTPDVVAEMIAGFEAANPGIKVNVEYLAYADGDDKVNTALEGGNAPDLIPSVWSPTGAPRATWSTWLTCGTIPTRQRSSSLCSSPAPARTAKSTSILSA